MNMASSFLGVHAQQLILLGGYSQGNYWILFYSWVYNWVLFCNLFFGFFIF